MLRRARKSGLAQSRKAAKGKTCRTRIFLPLRLGGYARESPLRQIHLVTPPCQRPKSPHDTLTDEIRPCGRRFHRDVIPLFCKGMKSLPLLATFAFLISCGSKPVAEKPARDEVVGVWDCSEFPPGFLKRAGSTDGARTGRIVIRDDGTCAASNFPQRTPYRFIDIDHASWALRDPSMTPSGAWSVEFNGEFLQCRRTGKNIELCYTISGKDEYYVNYKRAEQAVSSDGHKPSSHSSPTKPSAPADAH